MDETMTQTTAPEVVLQDQVTPGPWGWFGSYDSSYYLATNHSGRRYVMRFERKGMQYAQPVFQPVKGQGLKKADELAIFEVCRSATSRKDPRVYRGDIVGFRSADARAIAASPCMFAALKAVIAVMEHPDPFDAAHVAEFNAAMAAARAVVKRVEVGP